MIVFQLLMLTTCLICTWRTTFNWWAVIGVFCFMTFIKSVVEDV